MEEERPRGAVPLEGHMVVILALIVLVIAVIIVAVILNSRVRRSQRQGSIAEEMTGTAPPEQQSRRPAP
jgi:heme/copper-type cytochrome/quinol oxidase subunit 2